ncbi:MAG: ABC transporter substrate-binding protein [Gemmatimonadetes bacterium]|nr:ABC transporter substrate-binding protein [Gemmatimonadota bacterium]
MSRFRRIARALSVSGRFLILAALLGACQPAGPRPGGTTAAPSPGASGAAPEAPPTEAAAPDTAAGTPTAALDVRLGSVLPLSGSPAFRDYAKLIAEGVEVAAASYLGPSAQVTVVSRDDAGDPTVAASQVQELEADGALGAVGFLEQGDLAAAAAGRMGELALISPTARVASGTGVFSLSGADPRAAASMADYAAQQGFKRVAVVNSRSAESSQEADAFEAALQTDGVPLAGRFEYDPGETSFGGPLKAAQQALRGAEIDSLRAKLPPDDTLHVNPDSLDPVALFLPLSPGDVELVAPQVTFFGLDTLGIQVLGTSGWTDPDVLSSIPFRHTDGVIATMPVSAGPGSPGYERFKKAYEEHFQRSLVSPVPALGYDAAILLLEAAKDGARTPAEVAAALEHVHDVQGATGILSVEDGRVVRRTEVVRIEHGAFIPVVF